MSVKYLKYIDYGTAGIIQLDRPEAMNAFNSEMLKNSYDLLSKVERNHNDIIIVKGTGRFFSTGGDLKDLTSLPKAQTNAGYKDLYNIYDMIATYSKPYVALIDGLAVGGASVYAQPSQYRIVTERTLMSMPETTIGYFCDGGSTHFLSRLDNNFGIYMGMTGIRVTGFDLLKVGLATHFVDSRKLDELESNLIKCRTTEDVEKILNVFSSATKTDPSQLDEILPKIKKCFSGSTVEEIFDNLESDRSDWATKTLNTLKKNAPISLKVTHRVITTARNISIHDGFKMEMRVAFYFIGTADMIEGVRAALIDKDFKPNWSRKSIYDVTNEDVERFFKPLPEQYELKFRRVHSKL